MPSFWLAMVIILALVAWFGWIPPMTYVSPSAEPAACTSSSSSSRRWRSGYRSSALIMRITRSALLEVLREDYIRTARAKGQHPATVVWRHALKNAMLPVITVIGIEFAFMIGGLVVTETVFNLPGVARLPGPGDPVARLPDGAEPRHVHRHRRHPVEPDGRPPVRASSTRACAMATSPGRGGPGRGAARAPAVLRRSAGRSGASPARSRSARPAPSSWP
jgi:hypothetical protein